MKEHKRSIRTRIGFAVAAGALAVAAGALAAVTGSSGHIYGDGVASASHAKIYGD